MEFKNFSYEKNFSFDKFQYDFDIESNCINTDSIESFIKFIKCLRYFLSKSFLISFILITFSLSTFLLNIIVIVFINKLKQHKTVFDKIFIGHSLVDALVGILVVPNYCIYSVFGYWPLGKLLCHFYVSLDYTICHVGIMHMVFIAYARLRSLKSPKQYQNEFLISNAKLTIIFLWLISGILWLPGVNIIINLTYKNKECYFNFLPAYIIVQDTIAYLIPMFFILMMTIYILKILHDRNKLRKEMRKKRLKKLNKMLKEGKCNKNKSKTNTNINETNAIINDNVSMSEISTDNISNLNQDRNNANNNSIKYYSNYSVTFNKQLESLDESKTHFQDETKNLFAIDNSNSNNNNGNKQNNRKSRSLSIKNSNLNNNFLAYTRKKSLSTFRNIKSTRCGIKLNVYTKLYVIIATFCFLWLPFCILWPIFSVCQNCISGYIYQISYWMGYAQSLINPILLLILNPNYKKLKSDY